MKRLFGRICRLAILLATFLASFAVLAGAYDDMLEAVITKDRGKIYHLLQRGMDVNTTDRSGNTLLMMAARNDDHSMVEFLLRNNANSLIKNKYGDSALMLASLRGNLKSVIALVAAGAEIDPEGWTPLIYAAFEGHAEIVRYLLTKDVDIDAQSENGTTALMAASRNGHLEIVKILLAQDADVHLVNQDNLTAGDMALAGRHFAVTNLLKSSGNH
ncbi:MAG: ankyrin repeat domain-containing protein [Sterolibacterium sp.]|nr:ankyrin repeat domain-containing protein [Sterolibacterium sp.]